MSQEKVKDFLEDIKGKLQTAFGKKFVFLLVGRTGVGKSSTVNTLMGKPIARVGHYEPTTMGVESYDSEINGIQFTVVDTPGLCDDFEELRNDLKYLDRIRSQVEQIDSLWFVSRLDETRVSSDEKRGIRLISEAFGSNVWKYAVIVFTFANKVDASSYPEALQKRTELIQKEIAKYVGAEIANSIPSVAVDNEKETTPDKVKWLGELFTKVFSRISERGSLPFIAAMADSLKPPKQEEQGTKAPNNNGNYTQREYAKPRIELNDRQKKEVKKTINATIIPVLAAVGLVAGIPLGAVGAAIGGVVGAVLGIISWFGE